MRKSNLLFICLLVIIPFWVQGATANDQIVGCWYDIRANAVEDILDACSEVPCHLNATIFVVLTNKGAVRTCRIVEGTGNKSYDAAICKKVKSLSFQLPVWFKTAKTNQVAMRIPLAQRVPTRDDDALGAGESFFLFSNRAAFLEGTVSDVEKTYFDTLTNPAHRSIAEERVAFCSANPAALASSVIFSYPQQQGAIEPLSSTESARVQNSSTLIAEAARASSDGRYREAMQKYLEAAKDPLISLNSEKFKPLVDQSVEASVSHWLMD